MKKTSSIVAILALLTTTLIAYQNCSMGLRKKSGLSAKDNLVLAMMNFSSFTSSPALLQSVPQTFSGEEAPKVTLTLTGKALMGFADEKLEQLNQQQQQAGFAETSTCVTKNPDPSTDSDSDGIPASLDVSWNCGPFNSEPGQPPSSFSTKGQVSVSDKSDSAANTGGQISASDITFNLSTEKSSFDISLKSLTAYGDVTSSLLQYGFELKNYSINMKDSCGSYSADYRQYSWDIDVTPDSPTPPGDPLTAASIAAKIDMDMTQMGYSVTGTVDLTAHYSSTATCFDTFSANFKINGHVGEVQCNCTSCEYWLDGEKIDPSKYREKYKKLPNPPTCVP